ncbi:MAG: hypothetical protein OXC58_02330 [Acidimicrobiaceae bacterium]|nr:hypothetical protein [Acidimicrobiaceae bacterium]
MICGFLETCVPRDDVLAGGLEDKHFAAQLDQVVMRSPGYESYADAEQFFALTYPTAGLKEMLSSTFARLNPAIGGGGGLAAFRAIPERSMPSTAMRLLSGAARPTA